MPALGLDHGNSICGYGKRVAQTTLFPRKALWPMSLARLDNVFVYLYLNYSIFYGIVNMKNLQLQVIFEQFFNCGKTFWR